MARERGIGIPSDCVFTYDGADDRCPLCGTPVERLASETEKASDQTDYWSNHFALQRCPSCSWWSLSCRSGMFVPPEEAYARAFTLSAQREFAVADKGVPLFHLRKYLESRPNEMRAVHPRKFEELICSIFREHGFRAELTAYSQDGGIDIIVFDHEGAATAVQIKRNRKDRKIGLGEIHQFIGAMTVGGYKKGVYVTSSSFTRGARLLMLGKELNSLGIELRPMDAEKLVEFVASFCPSESREPWDVAWALRRSMPSIQTAHGDWGGTDVNAWPSHPPAMAHVEWWISEYQRCMRLDPATHLQPLLPAVLTESEIAQALAPIERGAWVEVFYLPDGSPPHHSRQGPFWEYSAGQLWLGDDRVRSGSRLACVVGIQSRAMTARAHHTVSGWVEFDF